MDKKKDKIIKVSKDISVEELKKMKPFAKEFNLYGSSYKPSSTQDNLLRPTSRIMAVQPVSDAETVKRLMNIENFLNYLSKVTEKTVSVEDNYKKNLMSKTDYEKIIQQFFKEILEKASNIDLLSEEKDQDPDNNVFNVKIETEIDKVANTYYSVLKDLNPLNSFLKAPSVVDYFERQPHQSNVNFLGPLVGQLIFEGCVSAVGVGIKYFKERANKEKEKSEERTRTILEQEKKEITTPPENPEDPNNL